VSESVLQEAHRITSGDRQKAYRHPRLHFAVTIGMLNAMLAPYLSKPLPVSMWPRIMACDKLARSLGGYKRDHPVDLAGYARTWEMVEEEPAPDATSYAAMRKRMG
jgi:hypothetical protein